MGVDRGNSEDARGDSGRRSECRLVKDGYARSSANKSSIFPTRLATARTRANIPYTPMWGMQSKIRNAGCEADKQHHHTRVRKEDTETE